MVRIAAVATFFALALTASAAGDPAGEKNVGNGAGKQFITGACLSDADCASGCCAEKGGEGVCSAEAVQFDQGKNGCGFGGGNSGVNNNGGGSGGNNGRGRKNRNGRGGNSGNSGNVSSGGATGGNASTGRLVLGQIDANGQCVCSSN